MDEKTGTTGVYEAMNAGVPTRTDGPWVGAEPFTWESTLALPDDDYFLVSPPLKEEGESSR